MISAGTRQFVIFGAIVMAGYGLYSAYDDWSSQRAEKKAEIDNYFRRSRLTPEQRLAEDRQKQQQDAIKAEQAAREARIAERIAKESNARTPCLIQISSTLRDPSSDDINLTGSYQDNDGLHMILFKGRAKNGFGGYSFAEWHCKGRWDGSSFSVTSLEAINR